MTHSGANKASHRASLKSTPPWGIILKLMTNATTGIAMSREDPQLRIRLPIELKEKVEDSAKNNNRSINAEIVQRLEGSFFSEPSADEIISAKDALQVVNRAKEELTNIIFKRTFAEINQKIRIGHTSFNVALNDLDLEGLNEDDFASVFEPTFSRLEGLGYVVCENTWDVTGFLIEIPSVMAESKLKN